MLCSLLSFYQGIDDYLTIDLAKLPNLARVAYLRY